MIPKCEINFFTSATFISYLSEIFLQYFYNMSLEIASFSEANVLKRKQVFLNSGYLRSTLKKYPIGIFSLIEFTSYPLTFSNHLNPP